MMPNQQCEKACKNERAAVVGRNLAQSTSRFFPQLDQREVLNWCRSKIFDEIILGPPFVPIPPGVQDRAMAMRRSRSAGVATSVVEKGP
jgi:hypothetical protein